MRTGSIGTCGVWLVAAAISGCLAQEEITPPEGAVVDEEGVAVVRLENPVVRGNVYLTVEEELGSSTRFITRRVIAPDGAFLTTDRAGVITDPWVWSNAEVGGVPLGAPSFVAPRVSLPMGGAPVTFTLHTKRGRERTTPVPPGTVPPPLGFDEETVGSLSIALDPRVLVLPVRVHHFVGPQSSSQITANSLQQIFDPGAVATESQLTSDDGLASRVTVVSGQLPRDWREPDAIWTQCDIQFHLEAYEQIVEPTLASTLATSCVCGSAGLFGPLEPISSFFPGRNGTTSLDIFIGGGISGRGCPDRTQGITCGPSNSGFGGSCADEVNGHRFNVILITEQFFRSSNNLLSHELGHMLGLQHPADGESDCLEPDDTEGASGLLMHTGGGPTNPVITPAQCGRARCIAARWLELFGRLTAVEREAVCAE